MLDQLLRDYLALRFCFAHHSEPCVLSQEAFGFIERADVVKEIFFHYSEFKGDLEALQAGDDVEFTIKDRNASVKLFLTVLGYRLLSNFGQIRY